MRKALHAATKATPGVDMKSAAPKMPRDKYTDAKAFLLDMMNLDGLPIAVRTDAAKQLLPYMHARMGETGKKETKRQNAAVIARGRHKFATKPPPSNVVPIRNE